MERVTFLVEDSGTRISCLLNPESLTVRRWSGVRPLRSGGGALTGASASDDPLLMTGGGTTEVRLDLLFDIDLDVATPKTGDVRTLTKPLWDLTENVAGLDGYGHLPVIRFVWGKAWNIRGVIAAIGERLECFDALGNPGRSWVRTRLLRVPESQAGKDSAFAEPDAMPLTPSLPAEPTSPTEVQEFITVPEGELGSDPGLLPQLAFQYLQNPAKWRWVAAMSGVDDPLQVRPGTSLRIPGTNAQERMA